ncbi:MAG: FtsW/RodA/SpoVE family cell cycle protein [Patescibacteria group bacterium]
MQKLYRPPAFDLPLVFGMAFLVLLGIITLRSIAPSLFPVYFLYLFLAIVVFFFLIQTDFEVISLFSKFFYIGSIIFLIIPLLIGQVTRGAIRWIPLGALTIQPAEIVRPFLLVFFAWYLTAKEITLKRFFNAIGLLTIPFILILIQPSLGVAVLTLVGFIGVLLAVNIRKKLFLYGVLVGAVLLPLIWQILAPYQKTRILSFLNPSKDPYGAGYNAIQSMISVGSGKLLGRGLGRGVQTQLAFLPERHTDFIFASIAEELGFVGAGLLLLMSFFLLFRLTSFMEKATSPAARAYLSGFSLTLLVQIFVHVGMNLGLAPISGVPFPLVSTGGSSLLATFIGLAIAIGARKS